MKSSTALLADAIGHVIDWEDAGQVKARATVEFRDAKPVTSYISALPRHHDWRLESADGETVTTFNRSEGGVTRFSDGSSEEFPSETSSVPPALWLCFPLQMPVWGRRRDDWTFMDAVPHAGGSLVTLEGRADSTEHGVMFVDKNLRIVTQLRLGPMHVEYFDVRPQGPRVPSDAR